MKKKIISLLVCITLVFTMTIPTYAGTLSNPFGKTVYLALGDSIGAGCKNFDYVQFDKNSNEGTYQYNLDKDFNDQFRIFNTFHEIKRGTYKDQFAKNFNVYAVDHSYVSRIAKRIKADIFTSTNGAFNGLRSKDVCHLLGIDPVAKGDYDNDLWYLLMNYADEAYVDSEAMAEVLRGIAANLGELSSADVDAITKGGKFESICHNKINVDRYIYAIKNSDIITVELGENDLSAFMVNMLTKTDLFEKLEKQIKGLSGATMVFKQFKNDYTALLTDSHNFCDTLTNLQAVGKDIDKMQKLGANVTGLLNNVMSVLTELLVQNQYYFTSMMNYINENKKPGAIVVVGTMINPINDATLRPAMDLFINGMNALIKAEALKYDYAVADLTDINLNPDPTPVYAVGGEESPLGEISYQLHPNAEDQQKIADRYLDAIKKVKLARLAAVTAGVVTYLAKPPFTGTNDTGNNKADLETAGTSSKEQESSQSDTTENRIITDEQVSAMLSDAAVRCSTEKTSKGIKVTAKVTDVDLAALTEASCTVTYKFYRSTKKSSGYKYMLTSKKGKYTNTSVKEGKKYYYKAKLVVTDAEGNEVTSSVLKNCKYGARTF